MPLISVIVPIYNSEKYLEKCIESICNQTYQKLEIILINDGSKDSSLDICEKWKKIDDRIILIDRENRGVSESRNEGLKIAKGDYISFVDSDDYLDKDCYKIVMNNRKGYDIIVFNYYYVNDDTVAEGVRKFKNESYEYEISNSLSIQGFVCNKIYKKELIDKIKFNNKIKICEDLLFNFEVCYNNYPVKYIYLDKPLYYYLSNNESATKKKFDSDLTKFHAYKDIIAILEKNDVNYSIQKKLNFIIDFNDYKFLNYKYKNNDLYKNFFLTYTRYLNDLRKAKLKIKFKVFISKHFNAIYYKYRHRHK